LMFLNELNAIAQPWFGETWQFTNKLTNTFKFYLIDQSLETSPIWRRTR
jgi:hypothetical protein